MDRIIYTAMNGAQRLLEQQSVISNNLANVNTAGFREQLAMQRAVPVEGPPGLPTRVTTATVTAGSKFQLGALAETGHALDVAIADQGFFALQTDEGEAYTRAGDFSVSTDNLLVSKTGLPVLSADGEPIEVPEQGVITFSSDGQITALGAGDNPRDIQVLGQLKLVNPDVTTLERGGDGLFRSVTGQVLQPDPGVGVVSGFIEKSNVSTAEAMVGMINNSRRFEMQMKVIQDASTNAERANSILSFNG
ncbi:flagellar basal-body rod protein FlgF [Paenalcaligenes niemegkensis]|uniref:flagellar basal-body rod protein FlgF n=1 Tax=Paenalcaligenes niemegkensis TaxID=2895469 RepID=UPI001EE88855|nr:flagellar basal-body rod protein FlgF [Paenalcaligenes niemegkensis]MCQ9615987.1 flagellar basal-body rod protein FlgF [Paenalcaligenes niemegkensis]